jgi:hypothetical protein
VLPLALGGDRAMAIFACGTFDGKFQCKATPGAAPIGKKCHAGCGRQREPRGATSSPAERHLAKHDKHPSSGGRCRQCQPGRPRRRLGMGMGEEKGDCQSQRALVPPRLSGPRRPRASMAIVSRQTERLRQFRRAASMAWSGRRPTATARRTQNCWAATACTTPRCVTAGSQLTQILKLVPVPRKSLLARCARTD